MIENRLFFFSATLSVSALGEHGYELHQIQLMQPSSTVPVGLKLTKLPDPLQYIFTVVVEKSKADLAGLKVNDWLIQIENNDIRSTDFSQVSRDIQHLLTTQGSVNLLVARKKSPNQKNEIPEKSNVSTVVTLDPSQTNAIDEARNTKLDSINKSQIRQVTLKEALGLDFNSYIPDDENQVQVHFISNVQPATAADRAGLRNGDRILTINEINTSNYNHDDVRRMMLEKKPIELTVINEPKYVELIESVQRQQNKILSSTVIHPSNEQEQEIVDFPKDLHKYLHLLCVDGQGAVYYKSCVLKKEPGYDSLGFLLRYTNHLHVIDAVETDFPAYYNGLREDDIILFVNKQNVEQRTHEEVKKMIRALANVNSEIHLILLQRKDIKRYRDYQEKHSIDWNTLLAKTNENQMKRSSSKFFSE